MRSLSRSALPILTPALLALGGCISHPTARLSPDQAQLVGVTTTRGSVLMFDTLPAPRITGDTVYGARDGVAYVFPRSEVATLWLARAGQPAVPVPAAHLGRSGTDKPEAPTLRAGQEVRVTAPSAALVRSIRFLKAITADTLVLGHVWGTGDTAWSRLPLTAVTRVEVKMGARSAVTPFVVVGAAIGAWIGGTVGSRSCNDRTQLGMGYICLDAVDVGALGLLAGAGAGLIVGGALSSERWVQVPLDGARPAVGRLPGGRLGLGVALAF